MNQKNVTEKKIKHTEALLLSLFNFSANCMAHQKEEINEIRGFLQFSQNFEGFTQFGCRRIGESLPGVQNCSSEGDIRWWHKIGTCWYGAQLE